MGNKEEVKALNAYLDSLTSKVYQAKRILFEEDKDITAVALKNLLLGKVEEKKLVLEFFQHHNEQMATRSEKNMRLLC